MNEIEIHDEALRITDPDARRAYLDRACGGDGTLRARVEAMLGITEVPESFLGKPLVDVGARNEARG